MKFSIIVGLYNQKHYLPKLIESLERQTFKDFEVHFCSDGCNDGTKEFFKRNYPEFDWHYHRLWRNTKNLSKNLNQGIKKAKGEYCVFIMGDSFPELNYLEILNQWVNPDSLICGVRVNIEGKKVVDMDYRIRKEQIPKRAVLLPNRPYWMTTGNGLTIPTEAMREHGLWDKRFRIDEPRAEDNEIIARLYYKGYLIWSVPQLILYHHYHKGFVPEKTELLNKLIKKYAS